MATRLGVERHDPPARGRRHGSSCGLGVPRCIAARCRSRGRDRGCRLCSASSVTRVRRRRESRRRHRAAEQIADAVGAMSAGTPGGAVAAAVVRLRARRGRRAAPERTRGPGRRDRRRHAGRRSAAGWAEAQGSEDACLIVGVLDLHRRSGGDLPTVLDGLARTLRERRAAHRDVRALTAQARLSGVILGMLPIGFFGVPPADLPARDARGDRHSARRDGARGRPGAGARWRSCGSAISWRFGDGAPRRGDARRGGRGMRGRRRRSRGARDGSDHRGQDPPSTLDTCGWRGRDASGRWRPGPKLADGPAGRRCSAIGSDGSPSCARRGSPPSSDGRGDPAAARPARRGSAAGLSAVAGLQRSVSVLRGPLGSELRASLDAVRPRRSLAGRSSRPSPSGSRSPTSDARSPC